METVGVTRDAEIVEERLLSETWYRGRAQGRRDTNADSP
jgi:hypothetical protein